MVVFAELSERDMKTKIAALPKSKKARIELILPFYYYSKKKFNKKYSGIALILLFSFFEAYAKRRGPDSAKNAMIRLVERQLTPGELGVLLSKVTYSFKAGCKKKLKNTRELINLVYQIRNDFVHNANYGRLPTEDVSVFLGVLYPKFRLFGNGQYLKEIKLYYCIRIKIEEFQKSIEKVILRDLGILQKPTA